MSGQGFLSLLRDLERAAPDKPPIGRNRRLSDETVRIGQDPSLAFPAGDFAPPRADALRAQVLGLFGPQGPLPLNTTEEVARWLEGGDDSFVAFTDLLATRFLQLFFRAWSDSHAITQYDHPTEDRFNRYVAAVAGVGTPAFRDHDGLPDIARLPMVSLFGGRVRCPVRLRQMIETHLQIAVSVEEHVPLWMEFEPGDTSTLGQQGCSLGRDMYLGARVQSVNDKIALHLSARSLEEYGRYLPGQPGYQRLADIVFWYLGRSMVVEVALSLPATEIGQTSLGQAGRLGWMAALAPASDLDPDTMVEAARFALDPEYLPTQEAA
ncbi:type VI secretion system baseplate subunit TssG (plasmid) [Paracoccus sp. TK19116]|uniref:Type VI secretion system baseplate subunit TssG n=1 Tax=Paracoccus albicereus TaxID=2922394 RepID=A0ABT1MLK5_9RHOB|nr:type VI secretion system baseplate subunit TssG [Paracoccus albicereus]MCQ0969172.1 type VI secretion system baseplate subunit TssG [Paracoccus albicereus]